MTKKSVIKIKNSMFKNCDVNNTYKSSKIHVHTSGTVPPFRLQSGRSKFHH